MIHLIYIPMRGVGIDLRGDDWFWERVEVFRTYTLQSLKKQVNQNFVVWMSFRPQDENSEAVAYLAELLKFNDIRYIFTFNGLMYYDDKFTDEIWLKIKNIGRIIRHCWRNKALKDFLPSLKEIRYNKNRTLEARLSKSLEIMRPYFQDCEKVIVSRIDSDDMYHKEFVALTQTAKDFFGAIICKRGLIFNSDTQEMAEWNPPTNPPFHTIIFPGEIFFDPAKHLAYFKDFKSHEDITRVFDCLEMPSYMYCVTTHNPKNHISTVWNHPFRGKIMDSNLINNFI